MRFIAPVVTLISVALMPALAGLATPPPAATDVRLAEAALKRDTPAVRALLEQMVDANAPRLDGTTGLHWCRLRLAPGRPLAAPPRLPVRQRTCSGSPSASGRAPGSGAWSAKSRTAEKASGCACRRSCATQIHCAPPVVPPRCDAAQR